MASTKNAVAKPNGTGKGTAMVSWKERMAEKAKAAVAVADEAGSGGQFISVRAGQLQYAGAPVPGNALDVVVVEAVLENCYYADDFDPDNPVSPVCYAFGREQAEMTPHEKSSDPQHEGCKGCAMNEFGSADKGKGKACKNIMRLAIVPAKPLTSEAITKSEVAYMKLPVTSVKAFTAYTKRLATVHNLPPFGFVTRLSAQPDPKTQFKVTFEDVARIDDDEVLEALYQRSEEQAEAIIFPYPENSEPEEKPARSAKKPAAKPRKY